ncbi:Peptidase family M23 [Desulfonauticus submarinus]|uniref:Peptidase family M23 n=2 Tax=Desulfonauticus submarinus TaxID=206665 RepID=A0A1H0B5Q0_9BACT|nr:Peptidase family M23 [Desulfonauticus submarinus]
MLTQKYEILIFKDKKGLSKKITLKGWMLYLFIFLFVGITGVNIYFGYRAINYTNLQNLYHKTAAKLEKQNSQLLSFAKKIKQLESNVAKMSELDRKLRVMMNLEGSTNLLEAIGGTPENSFTFDFIPSYRQEALARKMHNFLEQLTTQTKLEKVRQEQLIELLKNKQAILASTPSIWPTQGWISSGFGYRISPFTGQREFHKGLDISGPVGTPIIAPADGVVVFYGVNGGYGLSLLIDHGNGITTRYAHLQKAVVKKGERVKRGEIIAYMGNSGRSTGPHLHYEVRINGVPVNPLHYILN